MEELFKRKNIFDIERRVDLKEEYKNLTEYMLVNKVENVYINISFYNFLDQYFEEWPYRGTAFNITQYIKQINRIGPFEYNFMSDTDILNCIELFVNLMKWLSERINTYQYNTDRGFKLSELISRLNENIERLLESINMNAVEYDDKTIICKRDADVDSVLEIVPDLSEQLLGYLDFRNEKDIGYKRITLKLIADYLEPKVDEFKGTEYSSLYTSVMFGFNNFQIRHNNNKQIGFPTEDIQIDIYDKLFKSSLHLIRSQKVDEYKREIDSYKPH